MPDTALYRPYCTLAQVQKETRNVDTAQADWFRQCVNAASRAVEDFTRRDFWYHDHSSTALEVKDEWVAKSRIVLPWPIITLTEIEQEDDMVDSENYRFENRTIYGAEDWVSRDYEVTLLVKGTFGYVITAETAPPTNLPADLQRACVLIAAAWTAFNRKEVVGGEGGRESVLDTKFPAEATRLLNRYRTLFL